MSGPPARVLVLGAPGSGKTTLTRRLLAAHPEAGHFAVRAHFVEQMALGTDLGRRARPYAEANRWLPDDLVVEAVRRQFATGRLARGFVIEGMPGNRRQAKLFDALLEELGTPPAAALYLDVPDEVCLARSARRRVCLPCDGGIGQALPDPADPSRCGTCGTALSVRGDDNVATFTRRLEIHRALVADLNGHYAGRRFSVIDGTLDPDAVFARATAALNGVDAA